MWKRFVVSSQPMPREFRSRFACATAAWVPSRIAAPPAAEPTPKRNSITADGSKRRKSSSGWFSPAFNPFNFLKAWCAPWPETRQTRGQRCSARCIQYQTNSLAKNTIASCARAGHS